MMPGSTDLPAGRQGDQHNQQSDRLWTDIATHLSSPAVSISLVGGIEIGLSSFTFAEALTYLFLPGNRRHCSIVVLFVVPTIFIIPEREDGL
jgi:hypothetical protein